MIEALECKRRGLDALRVPASFQESSLQTVHPVVPSHKGSGTGQLDERLSSGDYVTDESVRGRNVRARQNLGSANPGLANLGGRNYGC